MSTRLLTRIVITAALVFNLTNPLIKSYATTPPLHPPRTKILKRSSIFNGIRLPPGTQIFFDDAGEMIDAGLSRDYKIKNLILKKGSLIKIDDGDITTLISAPKQTIRGILLPAGSIVRFFKNERIDSIISVYPIYVNGILFEGSGLWFYPNGNIKNGTSEKNQKIGDFFISKGMDINFYKNGNLKVTSDIEQAQPKGHL
jgi:hypothetical protein